MSAHEPDEMPIMTLGQEREYNPFLRLHELSLINKLKEEVPTLGLNDRDVFKALRRLRDQW